MILSELLKDYVDVSVDVEVKGLQLDSRAVHPGDLFVALAGTQTHGMKYAEQAVKAGAAAILFDPAAGGLDLAKGLSLPCCALEGLDQRLGLIADCFFGSPSRQLDVTGITGTNGKTSCSHFLAQALEGAVVGTLGWGLPGKLNPTTHTTPDAIEVHRILAELRKQGLKSVAMEASSHGLDQGRLQGVHFKSVLLTNLSHDHLDYHGSMQAYLKAKLRLLEGQGLECIAFNRDDALISAAMQKAPKQARQIGFSLKADQTRDILSVVDLNQSAEGTAIQACFNQERFEIFAPVHGDFNIENLLATAAVLLGKGFDLKEISERMRRIRPVPGRMEFVPGSCAVVDYAHTPDALAKALQGLRKRCDGSLWVVFGCGGDRDKTKRAKMGEIACLGADRIVLTDDNPRFEAGDAIIQAILKGCEREVEVIRDRQQAIRFALKNAVFGDVVLVAGKGHECFQEIAGIKHPFSDFEVVKAIVEANEPEVQHV